MSIIVCSSCSKSFIRDLSITHLNFFFPVFKFRNIYELRPNPSPFLKKVCRIYGLLTSAVSKSLDNNVYGQTVLIWGNHTLVCMNGQNHAYFMAWNMYNLKKYHCPLYRFVYKWKMTFFNYGNYCFVNIFSKVVNL